MDGVKSTLRCSNNSRKTSSDFSAIYAESISAVSGKLNVI